jgi:hypothetical protein
LVTILAKGKNSRTKAQVSPHKNLENDQFANAKIAISITAKMTNVRSILLIQTKMSYGKNNDGAS